MLRQFQRDRPLSGRLVGFGTCAFFSRTIRTRSRLIFSPGNVNSVVTSVSKAAASASTVSNDATLSLKNRLILLIRFFDPERRLWFGDRLPEFEFLDADGGGSEVLRIEPQWPPQNRPVMAT